MSIQKILAIIPYFMPYPNINLRYIINLNVKPKIIELLKEKIGEF